MTDRGRLLAGRGVAFMLVTMALVACSEAPQKPASRVTPKVVVGDIPCGADKVLKNVCQFCHTNPPQHGAPFPLVTYANTQSELDGKPIYFWMEKYVSEEIMPLPPVEISDADRAILLKWLRAGAPPRQTGIVCDGDGGVLNADSAAPHDASPDPEDTAPDTLTEMDTLVGEDAGTSDGATEDTEEQRDY
jgi:hypothetical protein